MDFFQCLQSTKDLYDIVCTLHGAAGLVPLRGCCCLFVWCELGWGIHPSLTGSFCLLPTCELGTWKGDPTLIGSFWACTGSAACVDTQWRQCKWRWHWGACGTWCAHDGQKQQWKWGCNY